MTYCSLLKIMFIKTDSINKKKQLFIFNYTQKNAGQI